MGRIIKKYGYNSTVKDEVCVSANTVKDIELMIFSPEYIVIEEDGFISQMSAERYHTACYAEEEEPGIHLYLMKYDKNNNLEERLPEIVTEEVEFCDQFYRCFLDRQLPDTKEYFKNLVLLAFKDYRYDKLKERKIYANVPYEGFGVIMVDDLAVATFERFEIDSDKNFIVFDSVGVIPDSDQLIAVFVGCNTSFKVTIDKAVKTVITDMTFMRSFKMATIVFQEISLPVPEISLKDDPEDFMEERIKIINSYEKEEVSEDFIADLL